MAGLLDFLQAASNAAASNVSGPVDGINWLLKKVGVPVSDAPVGGSQWMQNKGLTRPVQQGAAQVAGETVGLLSPFMAAQYAPQIAKGLLQAGQNMAAPATLNPQKGAIVWHGSPHKFDRFDSKHIGTGEGNQSFGYGLYQADAPATANTYRPSEGTLLQADGTKFVNNGEYDNALSVLRGRAFEKDPFGAAAKDIQRSLSDPDMHWAAKETWKLAQRQLQEFKAAKFKYEPGGYLYKSDLPDTAIAKMLDWDKPLSQQAGLIDVVRQERPGYMQLPPGQTKSSDAYMALADKVGHVKAAETFRKAGIPGIRYLDGGSRGAGAGTSNYVVFPGEEGLLSILERNGMPLR